MGSGRFGRLKLLPQILGMVAIDIVTGTATAGAGDVVEHRASVSNVVPRGAVETLYFDDRQQMPVRVVRGINPLGGLRTRREIMNFGSGSAQRVAVFRGIIEPASASGAPP